jgi:uncharacterized membrane protein
MVMEQAKRPVNPLAGPYGHPIHPALVTVPIGVWISSLVFDIGSRMVDYPRFLAEGSRWLIAIGVIGALVAALWGLMDLLAVPKGTKVARIALTHMSINVLVLVAYVINYLIRGSDPKAPVPVGLIVLSIISLLVLSFSGYLGGKLAYRYGVRVADEDAQADGYLTPPGGMASPGPASPGSAGR